MLQLVNDLFTTFLFNRYPSKHPQVSGMFHACNNRFFYIKGDILTLIKSTDAT